MSRWVFRFGTAISAVGLAFASTHEVLAPWPGVSKANVHRIQPGMDLRQVECILGGSALYTIDRGKRIGRIANHYARLGRMWGSRDRVALVAFDNDNRVQKAECRLSVNSLDGGVLLLSLWLRIEPEDLAHRVVVPPYLGPRGGP